MRATRLQLRELCPIQTRAASPPACSAGTRRSPCADNPSPTLASANGTLALAMTGGSTDRLLVRLANLDVANSLVSWLSGGQREDIRCIIADMEATDGVLKPLYPHPRHWHGRGSAAKVRSACVTKPSTCICAPKPGTPACWPCAARSISAAALPIRWCALSRCPWAPRIAGAVALGPDCAAPRAAAAHRKPAGPNTPLLHHARRQPRQRHPALKSLIHPGCWRLAGIADRTKSGTGRDSLSPVGNERSSNQSLMAFLLLSARYPLRAELKTKLTMARMRKTKTISWRFPPHRYRSRQSRIRRQSARSRRTQGRNAAWRFLLSGFRIQFIERSDLDVLLPFLHMLFGLIALVTP